MSDAYQVHPELASAGYRVLRPDGSTICVVCGHPKAVAICAELEKLRVDAEAMRVLAKRLGRGQCPDGLLDCNVDPDEHTCDEAEVRDCWMSWAREAAKRDA